MGKKIKICLLFFMISFAILSSENIALSINHGFLSGEAHEYVYKDRKGTKKSELIWGLEDVKMIGAKLSYSTFNRWKFSTSFDISYNKPKTEMNDYDWQWNTPEWTDWSNSVTDIVGVQKFDLNVEYKIIKKTKLNMFLIAGYKNDIFKWNAVGGKGIYTISNFRDYPIVSKDVLVISYNQNFQYPYVGIGSTLSLGNMLLEGKANYSCFVWAKDEDTHHLRDLLYEDYFKNGEVLKITLSGEFAIINNLYANASYDYTKYFVNKGYTKITIMNTEETGITNDWEAGIENETSLISLGLTYNF